MRFVRRKREELQKPLSPVALFFCPAYLPDGRTVTISGLYEVVEYHSVEPSAYVWTACVDLIPVGTPADDWEDRVVAVDGDVFDAQVYPREYGRALAEERWFEAMMELDEERRLQWQ